MTEGIRDTGDEPVFYDDQHTLLRVTGPTRLLGAAHAGVHVLAGGRLYVAGIIRQRLVVDTGGFLDVTGHLDPVRWPAADIEGTILIAVGARYGKHIVIADGTLAPHGSATP